MQRTTALMDEWRAETKSGENLHFEFCKGGYFSNKEEFGLKVAGKTLQNGAPSPNNPIPIQCIKEGTKLICGNEITVPCDLYEDDIWYPVSGKVEKHTRTELIYPTNNWRYFSAHCGRAGYHGQDMMMGTWTNQWGYCNVFSKINWDKDECGIRFGQMNAVIYISLTSAVTTLDEFKQKLQEIYDNGNEIRVVYKLKNPIIEQYDPQPIFAPEGTVNVLQIPTDLSADLSATMLIKSNT